jgi:hypothetical protein
MTRSVANHDLVLGAWRCVGCRHRDDQEVRAHPILRRFNASKDWAYLRTIDSQYSLNSWAACAKLTISYPSGAGIARRLPEPGVVIKTVILLDMP